MSIVLQDMVRRLNNETYDGEERDGFPHGKGVYRFSNGIIYSGRMFEGAFDEKGTLAFPKGGKFVAKWHDGALDKGTYYYHDDLEFNTDEWQYGTDGDRRFWSEIQNGIKVAQKPQFVDKDPSMWIPPNTYDVGNGYFDPQDGNVMSYSGSQDHTASKEEAAWAMLKCRIGVPDEIENEPLTEEPLYAISEFVEVPYTEEDDAKFGAYLDWDSEDDEDAQDMEDEDEGDEDEDEEDKEERKARPGSASSACSAAESLVGHVFNGLTGPPTARTRPGSASSAYSAANSLVNGVLGPLEGPSRPGSARTALLQRQTTKEMVGLFVEDVINTVLEEPDETTLAINFVDEVIANALKFYENPEEEVFEDFGEDGERAATKLQAVQRGRQDRRRVAAKRQAKREDLAATKIQAVQRGRQDRRRVKELREGGSKEPDAPSMNKDEAAEYLQDLVRGMEDRARLQELKKEYDAKKAAAAAQE